MTHTHKISIPYCVPLDQTERANIAKAYVFMLHLDHSTIIHLTNFCGRDIF